MTHHITLRCPDCGWLFNCPREQEGRVRCLECDTETRPAAAAAPTTPATGTA